MQHVMRSKCSDERLNAKIALIYYLIDSGAGGDASDSALHTCLEKCSDDHAGAIARALLKRYPDMLECKNEAGLTPVEVVSPRVVDVYKALIDAGANINASKVMERLIDSIVKKPFGEHSKHREILHCLIDAGLDVTACSEDGRTSLLVLMGAKMLDDRVLRIFLCDILDCIIARQCQLGQEESDGDDRRKRQRLA
jgi:hypothetical protein